MPPPSRLAAAPARLVLPASSRSVIRVANTGSVPLDVRVSRAGLSLGGEGRPAVGPAGGAARLAIRLAHPLPDPWRTRRSQSPLRAGALRAARARRPRDAAPVLGVRDRAATRSRVALRVGVVVVLRARGVVMRRLGLGALQVERHRAVHVLRIGVANRGDLDEWIGRPRVRLTLRCADYVVARPVITPRRLLARSRGVLLAVVRGNRRGRCVLDVRLLRARPPAIAARRSYGVAFDP